MLAEVVGAIKCRMNVTPEDSLVPDPDRIVRIRTVLARTGLSRSTLYRKMNDGSFPRQVKIGVHSSGWHESAINTWVADPVAYQGGSVNSA